MVGGDAVTDSGWACRTRHSARRENESAVLPGFPVRYTIRLPWSVFIEDNWLSGRRLGGGSFVTTGRVMGCFDDKPVTGLWNAAQKPS
jgi:hypothetical protein